MSSHMHEVIDFTYEAINVNINFATATNLT